MLNDLLNLKTYSTFPDVTPNYMGVEMEYEGRLKDGPVCDEVVNAADIKAIIAKYIGVSAKVAEANGVDVNEFKTIFTMTLRMMKVEGSDWAD